MFTLYFTCLLCTLVLLGSPAIATYLSRKNGFPTILTCSFFLILQQLIFAASAALISSYAISFLIAALAIFLMGIFGRKIRSLDGIAQNGGEVFSKFQNLIPWGLWCTIFLFYILIRAQYSYLNFNNNGDEVGIEKLFNLSLQQSFLYGKSYPPEWIWLAGEPIRYYIFLKSIPGLASWLARAVFNNAQTGGAFFILFEAINAALAPALVTAWIIKFGKSSKNQSAISVCAILLGLFCFFGTHFQAVYLGLNAFFTHSQLDWWKLSSEVIPFTDNQYPIWFLISGDSHAYMQIYFIQVLFWGGLLYVASLARRSFVSAAALGVIAAALVLSNPGSVLVDLSVIAIFAPVLIVYLSIAKDFSRIKFLVLHATIALLSALLFLALLYAPSGSIKIVYPARELLSPLIGFLNLNFSILAWMLLIFFHPSVRLGVIERFKKLSAAREWIYVLTIIFAISFYLVDRPALSVMVVLAALTWLVLFHSELQLRQQIFLLFAVCCFGVWILPEVVAFDHLLDNRTAWIRFQMSLRFWPEAYFLIPFALTLAALDHIGSIKISRGWSIFCSVVIGLFLISHIPGISNRISRSRQAGASLDGFAEFARRYPVDNAIVEFLRALPDNPRVVIAESCGVGDVRVPVDFAWPGRIAAFSGRVGVCGWARHAMLYNNPLRQVGFRDTLVEERLGNFLKAQLGFFGALSSSNFDQAKMNLGMLKAFSVTHIVFGQFEKSFFPNFTLDRVPAALGVRVVFKATDGMGVLAIDE